MSTFIYDKGRQGFLTGAINVTGGSNGVNVALVVIGAGHYVVNSATDQYFNIISGGDVTAKTGVLTGITTTAGVFTASNATFTSVSGSASGALVIYYDTGTASTSPLIAYIDNYVGLPVTPNGSNINIIWPTGSNGIFKL
jgi:hypothetical protein